MRNHRTRTPIALLLLMIAACGELGGPSAARVEGQLDLGPVSVAATIRGRDGGHSARFGDKSVWAFGDTMLEGPNDAGASWLNSTFATFVEEDFPDVARLEEPLDTGLAFAVDSLDPRGERLQRLPEPTRLHRWLCP